MAGNFTRTEIFQQPETWTDTVRRVLGSGITLPSAPIITGAGTSYFAAMAVEAAWPGARAVGSTELLLDFESRVKAAGALLSLARSGNSPESVGVVQKVQNRLPQAVHVAVTCNAEGRLANWQGVRAIVLDPRTNDRSLVMTSSYSNLVTGGLTLARPAQMAEVITTLRTAGEYILSAYEGTAEKIAATLPPRIVMLASEPMQGAAREAWLKVLEITAGRIPPLCETYLGLRHGPLSFVHPDTLVLCFLSSDAKRRRYENDVVAELREKKIGRLVALGQPSEPAMFEHIVCTEAAGLADYLRAPAEIVFPQLLAYHLSLRLGLDPDNPSPGGVINRVVQGVTIYEE